MKIFFISEKRAIYEKFRRIIGESESKYEVDYYYSKGDKESMEEYKDLTGKEVKPILLKDEGDIFFDEYALFFSWHCRQLFPENLVARYRCVNLHPSLNPHNRGWYPQVFSIYNGLPAGVTIHEMDSEIDMGYIICQKEVEKRLTDTSKDLYDRITEAEEELVRDNIINIIERNYKSIKAGIGNINYKSDFIKLCEINRNREATYGEVIDYLRAMTFGDYKNAYYYDEDGKRIYIKVVLEKE